MTSSRILVSGASGPIGAALVPSLKAGGAAVTRLVRKAAAGPGPNRLGPGPPAVAGVWSPASTRSFIWRESRSSAAGPQPRSGASSKAASRARATWRKRQRKAAQRPRVFISASAVGFYGNRGDEILREDSPSGEGFAAEICRQWEAATQPAARREFALRKCVLGW